MNPVYSMRIIYRKIMRQCHDETYPSYKNYGAIGVKVSPQWRTGFHVFYRDMRDSYFPGAYLARKKSRCGYSKENCVWLNDEQLAKHLAQEFYCLYKGEWTPIGVVCEETGKSPRYVRNHLKTKRKEDIK